ncbi:RagB/SusD family nutrient uptake outer membrane protein [Reichenbachiella agariperforans]|uniref:RagB/SusD family nutrient uptake outer membrane protein n=1 Tax=Reichenbachiella agariperforans TaxID=156994 RepID=UPI001C0941C2|nr:RagB/SusD family nutrient uptake outer membrane protein [Reichenbachiella agariperforans]MBU2916247.1 RagB/SusD family nutrient uptake outer membrane protein [Reichenbachiella agariperforans]
MMKTRNTISIFLSILLVFGCSDDVLDKSPLDRLSPDTFYQNEEELSMGLTGVYENIKQYETPIHWFQFDFMSDDGVCHHAWQGSLEFGNWQHNSNSWAADAKWARAYQLIVRVNGFLKSIEEAPVADEVKAQMAGEARFLRAYMYGDLIHFYGDVPLILEEQTVDNALVSRTPKSEVLTAVMEDLDYASANLPTSYIGENIGRATAGAALAYKARFYLYSEMWDEAADAAQEVIDLGVYDLFDDYEGVFKEENENNIEVIFDIQYMQNLNEQPWPSSALSFGEWPTPNVSVDLINEYHMQNGMAIDDVASGFDAQDPFLNRDPRLAATLILPGTDMGPDRTLIPANDETLTGVRPRKYADLSNTNRNNCGINTITMRYADVLLMKAEALTESGSTSQEIYDLVNEVRARVNMPKVEDAEGAGLTTDELRDIVRHERRVEFAIEGLRYLDMLRWKDESLVHNVIGYDKAKLSDPSDAATWEFQEVTAAERNFDAEKGWLWPLPSREIQNNENLRPQNPGY